MRTPASALRTAALAPLALHTNQQTAAERCCKSEQQSRMCIHDKRCIVSSCVNPALREPASRVLGAPISTTRVCIVPYAASPQTRRQWRDKLATERRYATRNYNGEIRLLGRVDGYIQAAGGRVYLNGPVGGDVEIRAGRLELGPLAQIGGKLRYASREPIVQNAAARVAGGIERLPGNLSRWPILTNVEQRFGRVGSWLWSLGLVLLAVVLVAALPKGMALTIGVWRAQPAMSALAGFASLICIPAATLVLFVTLIGAPLALTVLGLYLALLIVGYAVSGIALGDWALRRLAPPVFSVVGWRAFAAGCGVAAIALLGRVPWLGGGVIVVALLVGAGAVMLRCIVAMGDRTTPRNDRGNYG